MIKLARSRWRRSGNISILKAKTQIRGNEISKGEDKTWREYRSHNLFIHLLAWLLCSRLNPFNILSLTNQLFWPPQQSTDKLPNWWMRSYRINADFGENVFFKDLWINFRYHAKSWKIKISKKDRSISVFCVIGMIEWINWWFGQITNF